jgi:hypothetical protein
VYFWLGAPLWFFKGRVVSEEFLHVFQDFILLLNVATEEHECNGDWILRTVFNNEEEVFVADIFVFLEYFVGGLFLDFLDWDVLALTAFDDLLFVEYKGVVVVVGNEDVASVLKHFIKVVIRVKTVIFFNLEV